MKVYVINLPKDQERRTFQEKQLQHFNIDYKIINAVSIDTIHKQTYEQHKYDWQRPLRNVEVACYFSHQNLWEKIIELNEPALILEDDALLSKELPHFLDNITDITDIDYINLELRGRKKLLSKQSITVKNSSSKLYKLYLDRTGAAGYILYPSGARKLMALKRHKGIGLADAHITSCYTLNGFQVEPALVIQLDQCEKYNIISPLKITSNIGNLKRPDIALSDRLHFFMKRATAQIMQGVQQFRHLFNAKKREIIIDKENFILLEKHKDQVNE